MSEAINNSKIGKFAWEKFPIGWDFENDIKVSGETISLANSSITAEDKDGTDVTSTLLDTGTKAVSGTELAVLLRAGSEDASPYTVQFKCVSSLAYQYSGEVEIYVTD